MNRAFYITGIAFAVIFFFVCGFYISAVYDARWIDMNYYTYNSYSSYNTYSYGSNLSSSLTEEAGLISLFFFLAFIAIDLLGLVKVKTKTMKVMAIIGLAISGLFLLWNVAMLTSPGSLSFDEVGLGFMFYSLIMLAFCVVGLVQSIRFVKMKKNSVVSGKDILDS